MSKITSIPKKKNTISKNKVSIENTNFFISTVLAESIGIDHKQFIRTIQTNFPNQMQSVQDNGITMYYLLTKEMVKTIPLLFDIDEDIIQNLMDESKNTSSNKQLQVVDEKKQGSEIIDVVDTMMSRYEKMTHNLMKQSQEHVERILQDQGDRTDKILHELKSTMVNKQEKNTDSVKNMVIEATGMDEAAYDTQLQDWKAHYKKEFLDMSENEINDAVEEMIKNTFL